MHRIIKYKIKEIQNISHNKISKHEKLHFECMTHTVKCLKMKVTATFFQKNMLNNEHLTSC